MVPGLRNISARYLTTKAYGTYARKSTLQDGREEGIHVQEYVDALPKLKVKVKTIREVNVFDVEEFLKKLFGIVDEGYSSCVSIVADNEWSNDSWYKLYVNAPQDDEPPEEYFESEYGPGVFEKLEALYNRTADDRSGRWLGTDAMLDYAAWKGWLPVGDYTVEVMW
jgi:hypothetical protein